ncbi:cadmium-translocating P-type ATPase [Gracilibacillus salinarum]|uniref:Cd(2+)-exporting ATPase n=2 Tax=Gracilibacillus salinarum TaxID=2932255 RepID=A0ABY4GTC2_9BACI|nr:cadmium-translocating P-type ATPase [Gracilibacillus salinarum]
MERESCCSSKQSDQTFSVIKENDSSCNNQSEDIETDCCSNSGNSEPAEVNIQGEQQEYRISGMDCPSCALTIEKGLNNVNGIEKATVHYNTGKLKVVGKVAEVEKVVQKLGFTAEPINHSKNIKTYHVEGMDCGSCAQSIENHLNSVAGVANASVSFSTGKMKVDHEISVEDIVSEVKKIGYKAIPIEGRAKETEAKSHNEYRPIVFSGILIALGFIGSFTILSPIISTLLYAIAMVISGYKPVKSAFFAVKSRSLDMNVLMSAAAIGAAIIGEWFEGATVVWLFALGTALQNQSIEKTRKSIQNLMELAPAEAWIKVGSELKKKPVEDIRVGETVIVKPGDRIPLDGDIIEGETSVNQAPITGESIPVDKNSGDSVYAGTINESGSIEVRVTKLVEDTAIAKIIHLVEEAQEQKAPTQAFIDKFANIYTPIVFALALVVIVFLPLFGFGSWGEWIYKGLALLVVACPCALVISTPVAIVSAIGNAAKNGVLIKGGTFLEKAGAIKAIAFDKTGTLTEGKPVVSDVKVITQSEHELLSIAFTLENYSTHPIAKTIVAYAKEKQVQVKQGQLFKTITGKGVQATIDGKLYFAGNLKLFEELNVPLDAMKREIQELQSQGKTVVVIGTETKITGIIAVSDSLRPATASALKELKGAGVDEVVMLTGDNQGTAKRIADEASVTRYFAELMPEDKVNVIKQLRSEGYHVAMVGDGINDAPALATSDLGIAMGGAGTDTAMETADIVLMADNLEKLPHTMKLSRKALAIIKQNIWFSLIVKLIAFVLIFPGWLTLWMAVLSDTGAALIVILNALRLVKFKE